MAAVHLHNKQQLSKVHCAAGCPVAAAAAALAEPGALQDWQLYLAACTGSHLHIHELRGRRRPQLLEAVQVAHVRCCLTSSRISRSIVSPRPASSLLAAIM